MGFNAFMTIAGVIITAFVAVAVFGIVKLASDDRDRLPAPSLMVETVALSDGRFVECVLPISGGVTTCNWEAVNGD